MTTCPHCGYEASGLEVCPLCGARITSPDPEEQVRLPPWEDPQAAFPKNLADTWVESVFRPAEFFRGVPWEQAAIRPVLYYLLLSVIGAVFVLWWTAAFAAMGLPFVAGEGPWSTMAPAASALVNFFATPFVAIIGLVMWAMLTHGLVAAFAPERRSFRATVRAICYGSGPTLFSIVPYLGAIVGLFWSLAVTTIGLRTAHRMSTGGAVAVVILAFLIPLALFFGLMVLVFASLGTLA
jgi:hypothetical protein